MLIAYQAKITGSQIHWIDTPPDVSDVEMLILPKQKQDTPKPKRQIPESFLKGLGRENGDIVDAGDLIAPKRRPPKELQGQLKIVGDFFDVSEMWQDWSCFNANNQSAKN